jgi:ApeA N-terminal domain 1
MADNDVEQSAAYAVQDRGHFWWADEFPPDRHHLPLSAITGELKITREGRITVQLDGMLQRQSREPSHTDSRAEFQALRARRIRGVLRESGSGVLLFDLAQAGARHSSYAVSTEGFSAAQCLISTQQFDSRLKQPTFLYVDADLKGFEEWLWTRALNFKYGKVVSTAKYRTPKPIVYRLQNGRLSLVQHLTGTSQGHSELTWSESAYLRFRPDKSISMEAAIEWHRWLQDLMILLTDSDYRLEWPEVRWGKYNCTLYFQWLASKAERPRLYACPTNFPKLRDNFGTLFESWLGVRDKYGPGVYNYLGTRRGLQLYTENQFIMLVSGLESFHRTKYGDPISRRASAKLDKIIDQISGKKEKEWVRKGLESRILPNLARRIFDALNALPLGFDQKRLRAFADDCAKLRNELAHYGGHRGKTTAYSDFISSVQKKNHALAALYHALVLFEIGLDPTVIRDWAVERPPSFLRTWYFAEVGLIDHADPSDQ